jgi:hypothetical protein
MFGHGALLLTLANKLKQLRGGGKRSLGYGVDDTMLESRWR